MRLKRLLKGLIAGLIPDSRLRRKLWCFYRNNFKDNSFKIYFERGRYAVWIFGSWLSFDSEADIYYELRGPVRGYLHRYAPKRGDIAIDAGAYSGVFTLLLSRLVGPSGKVLAFEPDEKAYQLLCRNIRLNGASNVIPVNAGLWSSKGELTLSSGSGKDACDFSLATPISLERGTVVPVTTIDEEIVRFGLQRVNYIKMDIEGAEIEALRGAGETLGKNNVALAIASYHVVEGCQTYPRVEQALQSFGYQTETSHPEHLTTYGWRPAGDRGSEV